MSARNVFRLLLVLWAGSLWSLAAWVAPVVFREESNRQIAGAVAARLFGIETYVGIGVALCAVVLRQRAQFKWGFAAAGLLAVNQWACAPLMAAARARGAAAGLTFGAWHGMSAVIYLLACFAVAVLIWQDGLRAHRSW